MNFPVNFFGTGALTPYTDLQNLNLDWILQRIVTLDGEVHGLKDFYKTVVDQAKIDWLAALQATLREQENRATKLVTEQTSAQTKFLQTWTQRQVQIDSAFQRSLQADMDAKAAGLRSELTVWERTNQQLQESWQRAQAAKLEAMQQNIDSWTAATIAQLDNKTAALSVEFSTSLAAMQQAVENTAAVFEAKSKSDLATFTAEIRQTLLDGNSEYVTDPVFGELVTVQQAFNNVYNALALGAITAQQYNALEITAGEYERYPVQGYGVPLGGGRGITAREYALYAYFIFFARESGFYMYSPITGEYQTIAHVVNALAGMLADLSLSAAAYDSKLISADKYNKMNLTAKQYAWSGLRRVEYN